jgi:membrane protease YdiL (CAAX protease family)
MAENPSGDLQVKPEPGIATGKLAARIGLSLLFLACALLVLMLGANYYQLFPTNGNLIYAAGSSAVFLAAALLLKRSARLRRYWQMAYAFFVAAMVNLVSILFIGYTDPILHGLGVTKGTNAEFALAKVYDTLLVVIPILVLSKLAGTDLGALFIKKGNLHWKWGAGFGALILVNYLTSALIFFGASRSPAGIGSAILWGLVFSLSNSMLEELWVRGLFLRKLVPLVGAAGAVIVSSAWFAALHFLSVAYLPAAVVPIFVVNTFTLGLACGILMLKTDSIWGAFLVHAAADLFLFIATLSVH